MDYLETHPYVYMHVRMYVYMYVHTGGQDAGALVIPVRSDAFMKNHWHARRCAVPASKIDTLIMYVVMNACSNERMSM
eukprot:COSAG05_NODE_367_length_10739_cov_10.311842_7_plen_78_part_00